MKIFTTIADLEQANLKEGQLVVTLENSNGNQNSIAYFRIYDSSTTGGYTLANGNKAIYQEISPVQTGGVQVTPVSLSLGQTVVTTPNAVQGSRFEVVGSGTDNGLLLETDDYTVTGTSEITLTRSYPDGTKLVQIIGTDVTGIELPVVYQSIVQAKQAQLTAGTLVRVPSRGNAEYIVEPSSYTPIADGYGDHTMDDGKVLRLVVEGGVKLSQVKDPNQMASYTGTLVYDEDANIAARIELQSDTEVLIQSGVTLSVTADNTPAFYLSSVSNVTIENKGVLKGKATDYVNGSGIYISGVHALNSTKVVVRGGSIEDFAFGGVTFFNCSESLAEDVKVSATNVNILTNDGNNWGVLADSGCTDISIDRCHALDTAQGFGIGSGCTRVRLKDSVALPNGQHGVYAQDNLTECIIQGNTIKNPPIMGVKLQETDTNTPETVSCRVSGNIIDGCGASGITIENVGVVGNAESLIVTDNIITNSTESGIYLADSAGVNATTNVIKSSGRSGIRYEKLTDCKISDNIIRESGWDGILETGLSSRVELHGNKIHNSGGAQSATNEFGIHVQFSTDLSIKRNDIFCDTTFMRYGIFVKTDMSGSEIQGNTVRGSRDQGIRFSVAATPRVFWDNYVDNGILNAPTAYTDGSGSYVCNGSPEGVVTAGVGSVARNTAGGAGTTFYVKESGTGNTGWVAK